MKQRVISKAIIAITIFVLAITLLLNTALCEQTAWDCPECGRTGNTGEYCGYCAHPAPRTGKQGFRSVGRNVFFGHYEQDNILNNGPEEIEWIVLDYDEKENKSLLLSRYGLDAKPYNETYEDITWEKSTLRQWMNNEFMKLAFSEKEQDAILITMVDNSLPQGYSTWVSGGNNTQDQVFLLSYEESKRYFGGEEYNTNMRIAPTVYAIAHGAKSSAGNQTDDGEPAGWWWLRSPGFYQAYAMYVSYMGSFRYADVNITRGVVRPALWLNLDSDIF